MNIEKLREVINSSGITITALSGRLGISRGSLYKKLENGDFKVSEARKLGKIFRLSNEEMLAIFFE